VKVEIYSNEKKKIGDIELADKVFASEVKTALIHQVVTATLAARRAGTACTKTRSEVSGSTRKIIKQKHTGSARQGDIKAPHHTGGGITMGPKPRSYEQKVNKKMLKAATICALSQKAKTNNLFVIDSLKLSEVKTKSVTSILKKFNIENCLIVDVTNQNLFLSARNIHKVNTIKPEQLNAYEILKYQNLMITKEAVASLTKSLAGE